MSWTRSSYAWDAGRSTAIHDALGPLVADIRSLLGAGTGLVVYEPSSGPPLLLASDVTDDSADDPLLPNEPLRLPPGFPHGRLEVLSDLEIHSALRDRVVKLGSAVAVPWRDAFGTGSLVVGNTAGAFAPEAADLRSCRRDAVRRVRAALRGARQAGGTLIENDLNQALRHIAESAASSPDAGTVLASVLVAARNLFDCEVAYLSIPEYDGVTFAFDQVLNIQTPAFRHLRIKHGQGLGGLARELRSSVRSLDYARDPRLRAAPVDETAREGIVSAMAAPLLVDDQIKGVVYVGNRHLKPFTETDETLLAEFAGYSSLGLKRREVDEYRDSVVQRKERERLAHDLHDSVVRGLLRIGFEAEAAQHNCQDDALRRRMAVIGSAAEECMGMLRHHLSVLIGDAEYGQPSTGAEVLGQIASVRRGPGIDRTTELCGPCPDALIPPPAAKALIHVGQEALTNAEIHSGCRRAHTALEIDAESFELRVADDGGGLDPTALDQVLAPTSPHLGFRSMRTAVTRLGGRLTVESGTLGGLQVRAVLPRGRL